MSLTRRRMSRTGGRRRILPFMATNPPHSSSSSRSPRRRILTRLPRRRQRISGPSPHLGAAAPTIRSRPCRRQIRMADNDSLLRRHSSKIHLRSNCLISVSTRLRRRRNKRHQHRALMASSRSRRIRAIANGSSSSSSRRNSRHSRHSRRNRNSSRRLAGTVASEPAPTRLHRPMCLLPQATARLPIQRARTRRITSRHTGRLTNLPATAMGRTMISTTFSRQACTRGKSFFFFGGFPLFSGFNRGRR